MMPFAGPTEFIISIVNSVKMVNMPLAWLPHIKEGKSFGILSNIGIKYYDPYLIIVKGDEIVQCGCTEQQ